LQLLRAAHLLVQVDVRLIAQLVQAAVHAVCNRMK
jgi:hypothetical protein